MDFARLFSETSENTLQNKHKMDISKVIFASQGYFCLARQKVQNNPRRCLGQEIRGIPENSREKLLGSLHPTQRHTKFVSKFRGRVNREAQTVNWEAGRKGLLRQVSRAAWKRRINRELEAKKAHKPWISEGLNREVQTVN